MYRAAFIWILLVTPGLLVGPAAAQQEMVITRSRGVDAGVDYAGLTGFGPWDDRNYSLVKDDLALLADNEEELSEAIPAFYRVELRKTWPDLPKTGKRQYPRSALPRFFVRYGGYLIDGMLYRKAEREGDRFAVRLSDGLPYEVFLEQRQSVGAETRVTSPHGNAESAVAINPVNPSLVVAGSNGLYGQDMHYSGDGGATWANATLPLGNTCCDPAVGWSSNGSYAYALTLGYTSGEPNFFYRSADNGHTWSDLANAPGANDDPRREIGSGTDKCYLHVDTAASSPYRDTIYLTWHEDGVMQLARSADLGNTWSTLSFSSASDKLGIGSDITSDRNGRVYYLWPADSRKIWMRRSDDGGASFGSAIQVATTNASYEFPLPSVETRNAWIYVSADSDRSSGPFSGSVYVAWTDTTGPASSNPAANHARIRVAYSRNAGQSWSVVTPHETADAATVDRWNPWLAVAGDGTLYVIFYDTRRDPSRTSVDLFYAASSDGGASFATPVRVTSELSPNISDSFEYGDYNGLDAVMTDLLAIFTDNRSEDGGSGDSVDIYVAPISGAPSNLLFSDGFESGNLSAWSSHQG